MEEDVQSVLQEGSKVVQILSSKFEPLDLEGDGRVPLSDPLGLNSSLTLIPSLSVVNSGAPVGPARGAEGAVDGLTRAERHADAIHHGGVQAGQARPL
eukprot:1195674-Prorocentrum_minimum.AAC.2